MSQPNVVSLAHYAPYLLLVGAVLLLACGLLLLGLRRRAARTAAPRQGAVARRRERQVAPPAPPTDPQEATFATPAMPEGAEAAAGIDTHAPTTVLAPPARAPPRWWACLL